MGTSLTRRVFLLGSAGLAAGCAAPGSASGGPVTVEMWHGQEDTALDVLKGLAADFERTHPGIRIDLGGGVLADAMLQKITAALASGSYPDIAYVFGSDLASVARSPQAAEMTEVVDNGPDFWPAAREAVTINGRIRAVPALLDSLAVVCNKALFAQAGLPLPADDWRWPDFVAAAAKLTDASAGRFGTAWPGVGDEDTVWRLWPMVWDLGGEIIAKDGKHIGFAGDTGVRALEVVRDLAAAKSVYIDPKSGSDQMYQAFQSGAIGMVPTGPWKLPDIVDAGIDYHVVPLPTFTGRPVTISGPDTWTVFDNGTERVQAARTFLSWLTAPEQDVRWDTGAGSLPLSHGAQALPEWQKATEETEGLSVFVTALDSARVKPVHPAYPQISQAVGVAIVSVLLGQASPADALRDCAKVADAALLIPR
ncbi:multiple sugar transport system substrate-binding protein [Amycolatopsis bartoniae]|uniref:ABC transporter substrate-binding protein n=1 Tax=Amycolatopsis bartoniae TaxID=941986 RepID=A0A8H9MAZ0_9PSEU|nr:ABC transporter substrate-binding protein [Amycolatopsis bartoniae]MBB2937773.1 multiple sugar transport system substrate-binding protein [Amycolatopsis bartoniae]TVT08150.1 ABC transporter substrate-binding protein [Amycolatopsis bartoniae]GHF40610.1 ABC transporter substrate-binding protein [Amycolatopsis bartoniae]